MEHTYCARCTKYTGNSHIDSKRINNKVKLLKTKCLKCDNDKSMFLKQIHRQYKKKMLSYCCYCRDDAKGINTGPIITKNRQILNKIKCFNCNHKKSKCYKILSTQNSNYKC